MSQLSEVDPDDEECWNLVSGTRPSGKKCELYVGNVKAHIDEESLEKYILLRAKRLDKKVIIHKIRIFQKDKLWAARITINYAAADLLRNRAFWPRPLYARDWDYDYKSFSHRKKVSSSSDGSDTEGDGTSSMQNGGQRKTQGQEPATTPDVSATPSRAGKRSRDMVSPGEGQPECKNARTNVSQT